MQTFRQQSATVQAELVAAGFTIISVTRRGNRVTITARCGG